MVLKESHSRSSQEISLRWDAASTALPIHCSCRWEAGRWRALACAGLRPFAWPIGQSTLLLLARYGEPEASHRALPKLSQEVLAEMVGTTRSRVNFFMNKFRKLGFIEYNGGLKINGSLLSVVLHD